MTPYAIVSFEDSEEKPPEPKSNYTFVSANLLLGVESLGKFQNMPFVYDRLNRICHSFSHINQDSDSEGTVFENHPKLSHLGPPLAACLVKFVGDILSC